MPLTPFQIGGLDVLLNESVLVDAQLDQNRRLIALTLYVEMFPAKGERDPDELYLQLVLSDVARVAASLRYAASWSDRAARPAMLAAEDLRSAVRSIRNHDALFGWRFFDIPEDEGLARWSDRLSIDLVIHRDGAPFHTLTLWTEDLVLGREAGRRPLLDVQIWFRDLTIRDRHGKRIEVDAAIAASRRYWDHVAFRGSGGSSPYPVPYVSIAMP